MEIFYLGKQKAIINEQEVVQRLVLFPVEWRENVNCLTIPVDREKYRKTFNKISDDFLLGKDNSLGENQQPIENAKPIS